jgi:ribosomal protein L20
MTTSIRTSSNLATYPKSYTKLYFLIEGFRGRANRCYQVAFHRVQKARQYSYRDRKVSQLIISDYVRRFEENLILKHADYSLKPYDLKMV